MDNLLSITDARQFILIYTFLALQGDLETKETGLQEKEVVIQKLQNNLSHTEEELKVNSAICIVTIGHPCACHACLRCLLLL